MEEKRIYSGMPKSERPKTEQCRNPNKCLSGYINVGFRLFGTVLFSSDFEHLDFRQLRPKARMSEIRTFRSFLRLLSSNTILVMYNLIVVVFFCVFLFQKVQAEFNQRNLNFPIDSFSIHSVYVLLVSLPIKKSFED